LFQRRVRSDEAMIDGDDSNRRIELGFEEWYDVIREAIISVDKEYSSLLWGIHCDTNGANAMLIWR
jgi:hypothetical protein